MKLKFLGATRTVTGSKYLLTEGSQRVLIDCGLFQGLKELRLRNWEPFPEDVNSISAIVLTHAHIDHTGYIPLLVRQGYKGPIYASSATAELCSILLRDCGRIQEEDTRRANKYGYTKHKPALPLYTEQDAIEALKQFKTYEFGEELKLGSDLSVHMSRAGHILGSAILTFRNGDTTLVFTGDLGRPNDPIMKEPAIIQNADYLVMESTYGNRLHSTIDPKKELGEIISSTVHKGGSVIIPSFAVGRTQTILYLIYLLKQEKAIPDIPIYLDSPMAEDATDLLLRFKSQLRLSEEVCKAVHNIAHYVKTSEESKRLNNLVYPAVIISASGMAEGGRVLHHIKHFGPDPLNAIVFTGFQASMTRGDRILRGAKEVKIHGEIVHIRARIENLSSLSSHADYEELITWLRNFQEQPRTVFLTHGEAEASEALKKIIEEKLKWNVKIPNYLEEISL